MNCMEALRGQMEHSLLCGGLDPHLDRMPESVKNRYPRSPATAIEEFNKAVVDAIGPYVCAFKPNLWFYLRHKEMGFFALLQTIRFCRRRFPDRPVILDAKYGDVGSTTCAATAFLAGDDAVDGVTLNPRVGYEALQPVLDYPDKGFFILCRTSNPGADEFQNDMVFDEEDGTYRRQYQRVARRVVEHWNGNDNVGLVVGATSPEELAEVRKVAPLLPVLSPGIGAQGGDAAAVLSANAGGPIFFNASRSILYASNGEGFAEASAKAAKETRDKLNALRKEALA